MPAHTLLPHSSSTATCARFRAHCWDTGSLANFRAFSIPPAYDYAALPMPVLLVQGSEDGGLTANTRALAGLLQQRPAGATRFVELQGGWDGRAWLGCRRGLLQLLAGVPLRAMLSFPNPRPPPPPPLLTCLQGVGHVPMEECAAHVNDLLADWVRQAVLAEDAVPAQ